MARLGQIIIIIGTLSLMACQDSVQANLPSSAELDTTEKVEAVKAQATQSRGTGAPALWKLSDEGTVIFLFGTVHNLTERSAWRTEVFNNAFDQTDVLILEADLTSENARNKLDEYQWKHGQLPVGNTLFDAMSAGDAYRLRSAIKHYGHDADSVKFLQPWLAALRISQMRLEHTGFNAGLGVDLTLEKDAKGSGKTLRYLESLEDQMAIFRQADQTEQIDRLVALSGDIGDLQAGMSLISSEWLDGDVKGLGLLVANPNMARSKVSYNTLIKARNKNWAKQIDGFFSEPGTMMVAVGAAHLTGPDSLIEMIDNEERTLERVQ